MMKSTLGGTAEWSSCKTDHAEAYTNLASRVSDIHLAHVAISPPISGRPYASRPKTLLFAPSGDVLHYNAMSRLFGAIICRVLCIPTLRFVGDCGLPMRSSISAPAMFSFKTVADFLGMFLNGPKKPRWQIRLFIVPVAPLPWA